MSKQTNQDQIHMTTPELIKAHGYIAETHQIWTEDDYCLNVHRVLPPNDQVPSITSDVDTSQILETLESCNANNSKSPVIVSHGIMSSSADWVLLGPHKALAYTLCDNGFDVWLANARGNIYSKRHKHYSTKDKKFWNFSWHEIGYYDLPAMIDYILEKTGHSQLYYIGHSQGTTAFYVMGSERPEYNAKIKTMISLSPIAYLSNQRSPILKYSVHFCILLEWGYYFCNVHQWFPHNKWQIHIMSTFMRKAPCIVTKGFCNYWFYLIVGFDSNQLDESMLPLIFGHFPAGNSIKQIIHYSQIIMSKSFRKFDYGFKENLELYGSTQPPKYRLERIKVPIAIFYSENDFLTDYADIQKLVNRLPNVIQVKKIAYKKFNHIDYLWGCDAKTLLYNSIVTILNKF